MISNPEFHVRQAEVKDAPAILDLFKSTQIDRHSNALCGFVEYRDLTIRDYELKIQDNPFFLIAERGTNLVGFTYGLSDDALDKLGEDEICEGFVAK